MEAVLNEQGMAELGFDTGLSQTPIMLGEAPLAQDFSRRLFDQGVFTMAIGSPTIPRGEARVCSMTSGSHSPDELKRIVAAFGRVGKQPGVIKESGLISRWVREEVECQLGCSA
jgi:glycine C-acetyltransferase